MLEVCVDSIESAIAAAEGGASRIELCSALSEGGLTPTPGTLITLKRELNYKIPIYCMLRPRKGSDFVYNPWEMQSILCDIEILKNHGADGFVFGALTTSGDVDEEQCKAVLEKCDNLPVTFHRAFDMVPKNKMIISCQTIESLGFKRILTSGLEQTAEIGMGNIKELIQTFPNMIIMPGCGVNPGNLERILKITKCKEIHASAKKLKTLSTSGVAMGHQLEDSVYVTDENIVKELVSVAQHQVELI